MVILYSLSWKKKIIIAYLCSPYVPKKNLNNFIHYYKKYKPGVSHKLIICFKNLTLNQINYFRKKLKKIKHDEFIDKEEKNDFDFGTNKRVATKYKNVAPEPRDHERRIASGALFGAVLWQQRELWQRRRRPCVDRGHGTRPTQRQRRLSRFDKCANVPVRFERGHHAGVPERPVRLGTHPGGRAPQ